MTHCSARQTASGRRRLRLAAFTALASLFAVTGSPSGHRPPPMAAWPLVPSSAITNVVAFGSTGGASPLYVATASGLYRSASPSFALWTKQNAEHNIYIMALSPNPLHPDDLVYASDNGLYLSLDGGRSATQVNRCPQPTSFAAQWIARSRRYPTVLYAAGRCAGSAYVAKSADAGRTWRMVYGPPAAPQGSQISALALDPDHPNHVIAGVLVAPDYKYPAIETSDGGQTWHDVQRDPLPGAVPGAMAIDPVDSHDMWIAWQEGQGLGVLYHTSDGGRHWYRILNGLPKGRSFSSIQYDPLSTRVYVTAVSTGSDATQQEPLSSGLYASMSAYTFEPFDASDAHVGSLAQVTASGYLLSGDGATSLRVRPLLGPHLWSLSPYLAPAYPALYSPLILGRPFSPAMRGYGLIEQYFDKGALITSAGVSPIQLSALAADLLGARAELPVGGVTSTVTYRTLAELATPAQRVAPPPGSHGGVVPVSGGVFIPYSAHLRPVPGYVVPFYFWHAMTMRDQAPHGWLNDIGLPLTKAVTAVVAKGALGRRTITIQPFQFAVLTYDPQNPAPFRVERANIGSDYAVVFPQKVR